MSLRYGLLGLLNYGKMTGYELSKAFNESLDFFWKAQSSQIYRELKGMEKENLLTSEIIFQTEKPNKKLYEITNLGKEEFIKWHKEDSLDEFYLHSAFLMRVFFSGERSAYENIKVLNDYKRKCYERIESYEKINDSIEKYSLKVDDKNPLYWELTSNFGQLYIKMCLAWAEESIKILEGKK